MKNKFVPVLVLLLLIGISACNKNEDPIEPSQKISKVRIIQAGFALTGSQETGKNTFRSLSAFLFKDSLLVKSYPELIVDEEGNCVIDVIRSNNTRLYFLGDADRVMSENTFTVNATSERNFLQTITPISATTEKVEQFYTGVLDISMIENLEPVITMIRGYARLDVDMSEDSGVSVERIIIDRLAKTSYLFSTTPMQFPEVGEKEEVNLAFDVPLTGIQTGVCYMYEQEGGQEITIETRVQGIKNKLRTQLPAMLLRNHIYTVKITGTGASLKAVVSVSDWMTGDETIATPDVESKVKIDLLHSELPSTVRVSQDRDTLFVPYFETAFKLALEADAEVEVKVDGGGITVNPAPSVRANYVGNLFDIQTSLQTPGNPESYVYMDIRNKNLPEYYGDRIVIAIDRSQTSFTGKIVPYFKGSECHIDTYMDGEMGVIEIPEGGTLTCNEEWIRLDRIEGTSRYKIQGGYRPNDPEADGRMQLAHLLITHPGGETEAYPLSRLNYGLPVVYFKGRYWCKFNLQGKATSFAQQVSINSPAAQAEDLYTYLKSCSDDEYMSLVGDGYKGQNNNGLKFIYIGNEGSPWRYQNYASTGTGAGGIWQTPAGSMCPPGYELPTTALYNGILSNATFPNGDEASVSVGSGGTAWRYKRKNIVIGDHTLAELHINKIIYPDNPPFIIFGTGHQYNNTTAVPAHLLLASTGSNMATWSAGNNISRADHNAQKTRTVRCIKSPVSYVY